MEKTMEQKARRSIKKSFRFSEYEWSQIEYKCEKVGLTPSQYFQKIATSGRVVKQDCLKEKQRYLTQIANISLDINTIARKLSNSSRLDSLVLSILLKIERKLNDEWLQ
jgi:hypothetical protein